MATKKNSPKNFTVYATVTVEATATVRAFDFEEATSLATALEVTDFVTIKEEHIDSKPVLVTGVYLRDQD